MDLPAQIADAVEPVFVSCPADQALARLVPDQGASPEVSALVETTIQAPVIAARPTLVSALWLYVDELDRSHVVSQGIDDTTGSFWHGIMHRREGDFSNSHYWFRKVGTHPAMAQISGYDPHQLIDDVEAAGADVEALVDLQRREWQTLFSWCSQQDVG
jgi:hypothetical protein